MVKWIFKALSLLLAVLFFDNRIYAGIEGNGMWRSTTEAQRFEQLTGSVLPDSYQLFRLDEAGMRGVLSGLPEEPNIARSIALPRPDGSFADFTVWRTPVMAQELQEKFPEIQTYTAVDRDQPQVSAKIDWNTNGFHAMVFEGGRTFLINPLGEGIYIVYDKRTLRRGQAMVCEVDGSDELRPGNGIKENIVPAPQDVPLKQSGSLRRHYRLALSCTGEYAVAVAGNNPKKVDVLSAMVTTLNRVNGIYERELSISLTLVANNDLVIYTDPDTDPFTGNANNNGGLLLMMNQSNLNSVIGPDNYDIGHIFSTGGGGIASLESVCYANAKGQGVTGLANPTGDGFDVDYVAHEIGHQFGADHTFNANTGACYNNGFHETAYEPGGASTLMSYAGLCAANNLQRHSDDYFHAISLDQISTFITLNYNGVYGGAACGTTSANDVPLVTLPSIRATYKIPSKTPFELQSPEVEEPFDEVSYNWEQWDLGNFRRAESGGANFASGPTFRSYPPTASRLRVFPVIDSLLKGVVDFPGERLPAVDRTMKFTATARHIKNGWGTFDRSTEEVQVQVFNTGMSFSVLQPKGNAVVWQGNSKEIVRWNTGNTENAPISCPTVNILLSINGGLSYPYELASNLANNGVAEVVVPDLGTTKARIKVKCENSIFFDISDADFTIIGKEVGIAPSSASVLDIFPNPAQGFLRINSMVDEPLTLIFANTLGQVVWQGKMQGGRTINLNGFLPGLYFLKVESADRRIQISRKVLLN